MLDAASRGQCGTILWNKRQFYFKSQRQADESVQGETSARGFFFFNRAPLLAQARFLHARLALSSRSPHAFLCSPVKYKIMANMPQFAVLDKATG